MGGENHFREILCATYFLDGNGILTLATTAKSLHKSVEK